MNFKDFSKGIMKTYKLQNKINCIFDPITDKQILLSGLYATIGACKIYVSKEIPEGFYKEE